MTQFVYTSALSADEWGHWLKDDAELMDGLDGACDRVAYSLGQNHQALAALALNDAPFGFTWDDVDLLHGVAYRAAQKQVRSITPEQYEALADLAGRIAALLPPRKP